MYSNPIKTEENCMWARDLLRYYVGGTPLGATGEACMIVQLINNFNSKNITVAFDGGVVLIQGEHTLRAVREE